jgi:hypothetical protein
LPEITKRYHKEEIIFTLPPLDFKKIAVPQLPTTATTSQQPNNSTTAKISSKKKLSKTPLISVEAAEKELLSISFRV